MVSPSLGTLGAAYCTNQEKRKRKEESEGRGRRDANRRQLTAGKRRECEGGCNVLRDVSPVRVREMQRGVVYETSQIVVFH